DQRPARNGVLGEGRSGQKAAGDQGAGRGEIAKKLAAGGGIRHVDDLFLRAQARRTDACRARLKGSPGGAPGDETVPIRVMNAISIGPIRISIPGSRLRTAAGAVRSQSARSRRTYGPPAPARAQHSSEAP